VQAEHQQRQEAVDATQVSLNLLHGLRSIAWLQPATLLGLLCLGQHPFQLFLETVVTVLHGRLASPLERDVVDKSL
jgi:hypothetical protein